MLKLLWLGLAWAVGFAAFGGAMASELAHPEIRYRVLAWVDAASSWQKQLPPEWKVVAKQGELVLLQGSEPVTFQILDQLRTIPGIQGVRRDFLVKAPEHEVPSEAASAAAPLGAPPRAADTKTPIKKADRDCFLTETCGDGRAKYWAQDAVDAELMKIRLKQMGIQTSANVAVVDSGFDSAQKSHVTVEGGIRVEGGLAPNAEHPITKYQPQRYSSSPLIGDLTKDESGHGTMVSSAIAGEGRLGVAPGVALTVYRVTKPGDTGSTSSSILDMAAYRACQDGQDADGVTIINMSWGGRLDETGIQPDEEDNVSSRLLDRLAEMGCLIVKAAGNDNFRRARKDDPDDAYLRVAAIDSSRELADFSTVGEIQAPGERVFLLESTTAKRRASADRRCGADTAKTLLRFANGTSFAAPIAAGLAAQVVKVLKSGPHFKEFGGPDRIRLVNRILRASTQAGSINGLRAVQIAAHWNAAEEAIRKEALEGQGLPLLESMATSPRDQICEVPFEPCDKIPYCEAMRKCFATGRTQAALCPLSDSTLPRMLAKTAFRQGNGELGYHYARITTSGQLDEKTAWAIKREMVQSYLTAKGFKMNFAGSVDETKQKEALKDLDPNFVKSALAPYLAHLAKSKGSAPAHADALVRGMLASRDIRTTLEMGVDPNTKEDRGSVSLLDSVVLATQSGRNMMGDTRFTRVIQDYVKEFNENLKASAKRDADYQSIIPPPESTAAARVLDRLLVSEPEGSRVHQVLADAEKSLFDEMRNHNQHYGNRTMALVLFDETYPSRSSFAGMMDRQWGETRKAIRAGTWELLAPVEAHFLLTVQHADGPAPHEAALGVLTQIASGRGWGRRDDPELAERALAVLHEKWASLDSTAQASVKEKFNQLARESKNPEFLGRLLRSYWEDEAYGVDSLEKMFNIVDDKALRASKQVYSANPVLDRRAIGNLSRRLAQLVSPWNLKEREKLVGQTEFFKGVGLAWRGLAWAEPPAEGETEIPPFSEVYPNRLAPTVAGKKSKNTVPTTEDYLTKLFALGGKSGGIAVEAGFRVWSTELASHPELPGLLESVVAQPATRQAAKTFLRRGTVYGDGGDAVRDFLSRLDTIEQRRRAEDEKAKAAVKASESPSIPSKPM